MINLILMVGSLGVVLLIQTCFLDPIYVRVAIKTPWGTHEEREGPSLTMMLVGILEANLSFHIHQWS
jgi:hypothetical protein